MKNNFRAIFILFLFLILNIQTSYAGLRNKIKLPGPIKRAAETFKEIAIDFAEKPLKTELVPIIIPYSATVSLITEPGNLFYDPITTISNSVNKALDKGKDIQDAILNTGLDGIGKLAKG